MISAATLTVLSPRSTKESRSPGFNDPGVSISAPPTEMSSRCTVSTRALAAVSHGIDDPAIRREARRSRAVNSEGGRRDDDTPLPNARAAPQCSTPNTWLYTAFRGLSQLGGRGAVPFWHTREHVRLNLPSPVRWQIRRNLLSQPFARLLRSGAAHSRAGPGNFACPEFSDRWNQHRRLPPRAPRYRQR